MNYRIIIKENIDYLESINHKLKNHNSEDYSDSIEVNAQLIKMLYSVQRKVYNTFQNLDKSIQLIDRFCPENLDDFKLAIIQTFLEFDYAKKKSSTK